MNSEPFDYGDATEMSLGLFTEKGRTIADVLRIAKSHNENSKSNGSLMKCTPLAVWAAELVKTENYAKLKELCAADCGWIHPNPIVHDTVFLYCVALGHLLSNPTDPNRARDAFNLVDSLAGGELANSVADKKVEDLNTTVKQDGC